MTTWTPKLKNKIEDAKIEEPVSQCLESTEEDIRFMASNLLAGWKDLKSAYRVPRRIHVVRCHLRSGPIVADRPIAPARRCRRCHHQWRSRGHPSGGTPISHALNLG